MKLQIITRNKGRHITQEGRIPYQWTSRTTYKESGYESVKAMQKELIRRFPNNANRRTRKCAKGIIRVEGSLNHRCTQVVTLEF